MNKKKMIRSFLLALIPVLIMVTFLTACGGQEERMPPEGELPEIATAFVEDLKDEKFEQASEKFGDDMLRAMPKELLGNTWRQLEDQVGGFVSILSLREDTVQGYDVIFVTTEFEQALIDIRVVFDQEQWIAGLFFEPASSWSQDDLEDRPYVDLETFREEDVTFGKSPWMMEGTLTIPEGEGPHPAVILVHGSGPNDRDQSMGPNKPFKDLAEGLSSKGIAVLRYDKRTYTYQQEVGQALEEFTVWEETIEDALEAIDYLKNRQDIREEGVFLAGHSLGAMLAPRIAEAAEGLKGVILLAAPARPLEELMLMQMEYLLEHDSENVKEPEAHIEDIREQVRRIQNPSLSQDTATERLLGVYPLYWLDLRDYSPLETAQALDLPIILLQGERDYQVTLKDFQLWQEALEDKDRVTFQSYPSLNHLFISGEGISLPDEYMVPGMVEEKVLKDLENWIKGTLP